jgi:hypothetical protein
VIVVDTAVWADWLNGTDSPEVGRLAQGLDRQDAGLVPVVFRTSPALHAILRYAYARCETSLIVERGDLHRDIQGIY